MSLILIMLLVVVGYFVFVCLAMSHADDKKGISGIALSVLLIYGCIVGMLAAVGQYLGEVGLLLYMFASIYSILFLAKGIYGLFKAKPRIQAGVLVIFLSYLLAVLYITTFMRETGSNDRVQMEVLNWLKEEGVESFDHIFLNVAMFVPVGVIFPFITDRSNKKMLSSVSFGLLFSTAIETGQLLLHYGTCDIDDILSNSLGALIGAAIAAVGIRMKRKLKKE